MAFNAPVLSQVKYTTSGKFGIGTTTPDSYLEIKPTSSGKGIELDCYNYDVDFAMRNISGYGYYWRYVGSGSGNNNTMQFWTDGQSGADIKVSETYQNGEFNYFSPQIEYYCSEADEYDKSFITHALHNHTENYCVYNSNSSPLMTFCVWGNGIVHCNTVQESSDISLKENINGISNSINLIKQLKPVSYNRKQQDKSQSGDQRLEYGLIAQEVEAILPDVVVERSDGLKSINYRQVFVLLIDAVNSQQKEIEQLKEEIVSISSYKKSVVEDASINGYATEITLLQQNIPNPFSENTEIKYFIPDGSRSAILFVFNMQGELVKQDSLFGIGEGSYILNGSELQPGMYIYSLVIDDKEMASKRMILTK